MTYDLSTVQIDATGRRCSWMLDIVTPHLGAAVGRCSWTVQLDDVQHQKGLSSLALDIVTPREDVKLLSAPTARYSTLDVAARQG